jgi:hypothetical protein
MNGSWINSVDGSNTGFVSLRHVNPRSNTNTHNLFVIIFKRIFF